MTSPERQWPDHARGAHRSSLIVAGNGLVERPVEGSALDVLNEVVTWEPKP
jgi:hypothetical protein